MDETKDLSEARRAVQRAANTADDREVREVLSSVDEGLMEIVGADKTQESHPHADRLKELEEKLGGLEEHVDDMSYDHVKTARTRIERYRENHPE